MTDLRCWEGVAFRAFVIHVYSRAWSAGSQMRVDTALAESVVDTIESELIRARVWQTRRQLELAIVEYLDWFQQRAPARVSRRSHSGRIRRP